MVIINLQNTASQLSTATRVRSVSTGNKPVLFLSKFVSPIICYIICTQCYELRHAQQHTLSECYSLLNCSWSSALQFSLPGVAQERTEKDQLATEQGLLAELPIMACRCTFNLDAFPQSMGQENQSTSCIHVVM